MKSLFVLRNKVKPTFVVDRYWIIRVPGYLCKYRVWQLNNGRVHEFTISEIMLDGDVLTSIPNLSDSNETVIYRVSTS